MATINNRLNVLNGCAMITAPKPLTLTLLHFAWVVDDAKCIVLWSRASVCLSAVVRPHYCADPDVTWGMVGVPSSCALFDRFAIGARVSLQWQHSAEREMSASACTRSMPGSLCVVEMGGRTRSIGLSHRYPNAVIPRCRCGQLISKNVILSLPESQSWRRVNPADYDMPD